MWMQVKGFDMMDLYLFAFVATSSTSRFALPMLMLYSRPLWATFPSMLAGDMPPMISPASTQSVHQERTNHAHDTYSRDKQEQ